MTSPAMAVYERHVAALTARDLDAVVADYALDAILVGFGRIGRGHDYIKQVFAGVLDASAQRPDLLRLGQQVETIENGNVVFASWRTTAHEPPHLAGADTFVVEDGLIVVHTGFVASAPGTATIVT